MAESSVLPSAPVPSDFEDDDMTLQELEDASIEAADDLGAAADTDQEAESHLAFIQEIRSNRLTLLWKATIVGVVIFVWLVLLFTGDADTNLLNLLLPVAVVVVSSLATRFLLLENRYTEATWAYALGVVLAISIMLIAENEDSRTLVPALGILVMFVIGMLMSVRDTLALLIIAYLTMVTVPLIVTGDIPITEGGLFSFLLMGLAALLVTQVSGELYDITNWALSSYRKERQTATELHMSQLELQKSFLKQKNLTIQLQSINQELDEAREAAEIAKQFRGQFLANMSHELRTPLNAIIGFSETMLTFPMMYDNVSLPEEYREDLQRIYNSGVHLLGIINDILDLSKIDVGRLEVEIQPVDLEPIFKGLLSTAVGLVGTKPIELKRDTPDTLPMVIGDPLRVRQVLINLYSNATKFTEEGTITLGVTTQAETVTISVEDTGPGIAPHNLEQIFEAFQQGESGRKQQRAGAGLGLAISKQLLDLMKGDIWVESEIGKGSIFYIQLPRYHMSADDEWTEVVEEDGDTATEEASVT